MPICIVGDPRDLTSTYISWLCEQRGIETVILAEDQFGIDWYFSYEDQNFSSGYLQVSDTKYPFSSIDGVFVRLNPNPELPEGLDLPIERRSVFVVERRKALQYFLNSIPVPVVNRPFSGRSNGSKPYQMQMLENAGFRVPEWLVSNAEEDIVTFCKNYQEKVVYKSCSGLRSKVKLVDDQLFKRLAEGTSPVIVQEYIEGSDVRVHVVGERVFPTLIKSGGIDYRFESDDNEFEPTEIPGSIKKRCIEVAYSERLSLAGFDFRVSAENEWYCLEVNPVPTFLPYEMSTEQPIGESILDLFSAVEQT